MSKLAWGAAGSRLYETGVDRGVLYVAGENGVPWNGLISVTESPTGGEPQPYYADGFKYANISTSEEFEATIEAYTAPPEFAKCEGLGSIHTGLFIGQQPRKPFNMAYRTRIGSDLSPEHGYKIHIIYNALTGPSERVNTTLNDSPEAMTKSWEITTTPPNIAGYKPSSHLVIDSRLSDPVMLGYLEGVLYGAENMQPRIPSATEIISLFSWQASGRTAPIYLVGNAATDTEFVENLNKNPSFETSDGSMEVQRNLATHPWFAGGGNDVELWKNLATNPSFEAGSGTKVLVRRNHTPNPTMTGNISSWGANSANWVASHDAVTGRISPGCIKMTCATSASGDVNHFGNKPAASPNQNWVGSAYVYIPGGSSTIRIMLDFRNSTDQTIGTVQSEIVVPGSTWTRISVSGVAPEGTVSLFTRVGYSFGVPVGWVFYVDDVLLENAGALRPYFDGETPDSGDFIYDWVGTPHLSASTQSGDGVLNVSSMQNGACIRSSLWSKRGTASLRSIPWATNTDNTVMVAGNPGVSLTGYGVTLEPGRTYTAMVVCRLLAPQTGTLHAGARSIQVIHNSAASWVGHTTIYSNQAPNVAGEHQLQVTFTIPSNAVSGGIRLVNGAPDGGGDVWWDSLLIVEGDYRGDYFDGSIAAAGDFTYAWTGAANSTSSIKRGKGVWGWFYRWAGGDNTNLYQLQSETWKGSKIARTYNKIRSTLLVAIPLTTVVTPNEVLTGSIWVRLSRARQLRITVNTDVGLVAQASHISVPAGVWTELKMSMVMPAGATKLTYFNLNGENYPEPGDYIDMAAATLVRGSYLGDNFSGSMPAHDEFTYSWAGTVGASESIQTAPNVAGYTLHGTNANGVVYQGLSGALSGTKVARLRVKTTDNMGVLMESNDRVPASAGNLYTAYGSIRQDQGSLTGRYARVLLYFYKADSTYITMVSSAPFYMDGSYMNPETTAEAPPESALASMSIYVYGAQAGDLYSLDSYLITNDDYSTDSPYFDGSTTDVVIYRRQEVFPQWEGSAHASVSEFSFYPALDREARPNDAMLVGTEMWIYNDQGFWEYHSEVPGLTV